MAKSAVLRLHEHRMIVRLAGECREVGDEHRRWRLHFLAGLAAIVAADVSVGAEVVGIAARRPRELENSPADWGFESGFDIRGWMNALQLLQTDPHYKCTLHYYFGSCQELGTPMRRSELISTRDWQRSKEYDAVYRTIGVDHNVVCFRNIPGADDAALGGVLSRARGRRDFSEREVAVVREAYAAMAPLVGGALARVSEPSPGDLPPRARQVLRCLLEGDGDKQIAVRLRIGKHTVNQYLKAIFRHFGVQSRPELLARWIRRGWGARFAWADD